MGHRAGFIWTAVFGAFVLGCGSSGDSGGRGSVPVLQGEAAIEAGAAAAVGLSDAIRMMLIDPALAGDPMTSETATAARRSRSVGSRAQVVACPSGGSVDGECREDGGRTIIRTNSQNCASLVDEVVVVADGRADLVLDGTGICGLATLPVGLSHTIEFRDFREEWRDGAVAVRAVEFGRMKLTRRPRAGGCSANEGETEYDGDVTLASEGVDMTLRMQGVAVEVSSQGDPCDEAAVVDGLIDVSDRSRGARFVADLRAAHFMHRRVPGGASEMAIDGVVDIDCVGEVLLSTSARLVLDGGSCPADGTLAITVGGGATSSLRFGPSGMQLDYDGDGVADRTAPTCGSESLEVCM